MVLAGELKIPVHYLIIIDRKKLLSTPRASGLLTSLSASTAALQQPNTSRPGIPLDEWTADGPVNEELLFMLGRPHEHEADRLRGGEEVTPSSD